MPIVSMIAVSTTIRLSLIDPSGNPARLKGQPVLGTSPIMIGH